MDGRTHRPSRHRAAAVSSVATQEAVRHSVLTAVLIAMAVNGNASAMSWAPGEYAFSVYLHLIDRPAWPSYQPQTAFAEVQSIWARYGVIIEWGTTLTSGRHYNLTLQVRADEEEFERESPGHSQAALGAVLFVGGTRPRHILFVSPSATRRLVEHTLGSTGSKLRELIYARMLGRAIAHELGHILLVSKAHAPNGLMRARFEAHDVMASSKKAFALEPSEIAALAAQRDLVQWLARSPELGAFDRLAGQP